MASLIFRAKTGGLVLQRATAVSELATGRQFVVRGLPAFHVAYRYTTPQFIPIRLLSSTSSSNGPVNVKVDVGDKLEIPGAEKGGRKLAAVYTCKICDTRSVKQFTERAYKYGVVIATCPGCQNRHLLADRLGYFDNKPVDLETIAKENGESLKSIGDGVTEIDLEDLIGQEKMQELLAQAELSSDTSS